MIALPVQQLLLKDLAKPAKKIEFNSQALKENWSECALGGNSAGVINMARVNFYEKNFEAAEAWMKFGTYELQSPSVILFYGDWLNMQGNHHKARHLYNLARKKAISINAPKQFLDEVNKRLKK